MGEERRLLNATLLSPLTVPPLFAAAALLSDLLAAAQPQRAPPGAIRASCPAHRRVQYVQQQQGPTQKKGDLQFFLNRLHHHQ